MANNKYLDDYDPEKEAVSIGYVDANNLYGLAMSQCLPTGDFEWLSDDAVKDFDPMGVAIDGAFGYVLEVDLHYPVELHDLHNGFPLAPEKMLVVDEMLSPYASELKQKFGLPSCKMPKLLTTLADKKNYVLHFRNLQLYLRLGLKLTKIHKILRFEQSPFMKSYIDFNTEKRKAAKNPFEVDLYKFYNNVSTLLVRNINFFDF